MSRKQEIYKEMLLWSLSYIRNVQSRSWWRKAFDRSCFEEAELTHNLHASILAEEFTKHDIHFLNNQARRYCDKAKKTGTPNYKVHRVLIKELFELVPEDMRSELKWKGPEY